RRFTPYEEPHPEHKYEEHVITRIMHRVVDRSYETASNEMEYANAFEAIPSRVPLTPHRETRRPRIEGAQVAIVAGPSGEEIHTDKYGRIKLWYPWDRKAKKDGSDTCWVRVAQNWAGGQWGGQIIPRIGMEVMVAFIDGDPDRPLVTGVVPNPKNAVPYDLPTNKTKSVFRTNTHKGKGYNELTFEDEKDREEVYIHAQKDQNIKVENNYSKRINTNKVESVGHNKATEVTNNHYEVVGGDMEISVGPTQKGKYTPQNASDLKEGIGGVAYSLGKNGETAKGSGTMQISIEKNKVESIGNNHSQLIQKNKSVNVKSNYYIDVTEELVIDAGKRIVLKCGQSIILLNSDGSIQINGKKLSNNISDIIKLVSDVVKVN
ncbi:type VI secretion system tip protein VgrG, partial [Agrobacterium vitis]